MINRFGNIFSAVQHIPFNLTCNWIRSSMLTRHLYTTNYLYKRRKTAEEKKSPKIIEYSPKKLKNKILTFGVVDVWRRMTVEELASSLSRSLDDVQEVMLYVDGADNIEHHAILEDLKIIQEIVKKCGMKSRVVAAPQNEVFSEMKDRDIMPQPTASQEKLKPRPPVVTVMGHVDHGKTTLLDSLRGASVAAGEAGGITQHIGAFTVILDSGEKVTFLDTPGHAAFSAMRARGANITDIIVLVVAAEDGVMAQTKEVIRLAQESKVPIIIAVNKIDKPEADIEKTKRDLMQMGLALEENGGEIQVVPVSALKGTNLQLLTETICTQATLMSLSADPTGLVEGVVVESKTDPRRGKLSTAIVTRGTLRKGSILVSGLAHAKVRGLFDDNGKPVETAPPGTPVEIIGWRELPLSGDLILEVENEKNNDAVIRKLGYRKKGTLKFEFNLFASYPFVAVKPPSGKVKKAHSVIRWREAETQKEKAVEDLVEIRKKEEEHLEKYRKERDARRLAGRFRLRQGQRSKESAPDSLVPRVNIILKGDVHGSVEAILDVLETYASNDRCRLDVIHYGVGNITEGDIDLAKAFDAIIYAFSLNTVSKKTSDVTVRRFDVIYHLINDLKEVISTKLAPVEVEDIIGEAAVLQQFFITDGRKEVPVAGCRCTKGALKKACKFRLVRDNEVIYDGQAESLRHLKNEVDTIKKDVECGLRMQDTKVVPQPGDIIVCYTTHMENQKTDWDPGF